MATACFRPLAGKWLGKRLHYEASNCLFVVSVPLRGNGWESFSFKGVKSVKFFNEVSVPLRGNGWER